jgi:uncharacterized integral membrane protein
MGRVIVTAILVVVLAVLVSMNIGSMTTVNLFGTKFENVSVIAVAAISFALGVVYSVIIHISKSLRRRAKRELSNRNQQLMEREKELSNRQSAIDRPPDVSEPMDKEGLQREVKERAGDDEKKPLASEGRLGFAKFFDFLKTRS